MKIVTRGGGGWQTFLAEQVVRLPTQVISLFSAFDIGGSENSNRSFEGNY